MLTENGKNWIAQNLGVTINSSYCYSYNQPLFYWFDPDTQTEKTDTGTYKAVRTLVAANMAGVANTTYVRIGYKKYYYSNLKTGNDNNDVTLGDLDFILNNDGYPSGENQYCYTPTAPPPTPECTEGETKCVGNDLYKCINGKWSLFEANSPQCAAPPIGTGVCVEATDSLTGNPVTAWIYVDGDYTARSTPECLDLEPGDHTITLKAPGYEDVTKTVYVIAGQQPTITIQMTPVPEEEIEKVEIEVIPPEEIGPDFNILLAYSSIPPRIARGVPTRIRLYATNTGGVPIKLQLCLELEHIATGKTYGVGSKTWCSEDLAETERLNAGEGRSYYMTLTVPEEAPYGTYWLYVRGYMTID